MKNRIDLIRHLPAVIDLAREILDRIPKEEMIARYKAGGLRIRGSIEDTEIAITIRPKEGSA